MRFAQTSAAAVIAASLPLAFAQTSTECDPTKKSCPSDTGLNQADFSADFTQGSSANSSFSAAAYTTITYGSNGAEFSIGMAGQAPTIQTDFYFLFGRVDVMMQAASGTGIVSSIVLESDDLDEIDWEFLGGDTKEVQSNFFGKGNTTAYDRVQYIGVSSPQTEFHTYSIDWNQDRLQWLIDGSLVRTLEYTDPLTNGGNNYPQTPMRLKLGNWCGGCDGSPEGTVTWAGGKTTFGSDPYVMTVKSVKIHNQNPAADYEYGDMTGSWESIKVNGQSTGNYTSGGSGSSGSANTNSTASGNSTSAIPTSSVSVAPIANTDVAVSSTITAPAYSTNTASASAQNTGIHTSTRTTSGSATGASATPSNSPGAASGLSALTGASLLSVALGFFML